MDLIISHENTDIDGLAGMIAASKLYTEAKVVVSENMTTLAQRFLALYKDEFEIFRYDDIDYEGIDRVIVIDTHEYDRLGKLTELINWDQVEVIVYDHHPHQKLDWIDIDLSENVGSATSIIVNRLKRENIKLNRSEATLFALGISADTGNFMHLNTESEDLIAFAYLLDMGANKKAINEYLLETLDKNQKRVFELLIKHRKDIKIKDKDITLFTLKYPRYVTGLNNVVEKIKLLYQLSVVFVLVEMEGKVIIIGRSSDENVNLEEIFSELGGGGHSGAGSVSIKTDLEIARNKLETAIRDKIKVAVKVKEVMHEPTKVHESTKLIDVKKKMKKHNITGVLVTNDEDKVKGIFTTRDLRRLNDEDELYRVPVKGYMTKKLFFIQPDDTIHKAQERMVKKDIGRLPVKDDKGAVVGIITRRDILNQYYEEETENQNQNRYVSSLVSITPEKLKIPDKLDQLSDEIRKLFKNIGKIAQDKDSRIFLVGGMVRDLLLEQENKDLDFVVDGNIEGLIREIAAKYDVKYKYNENFQTGSMVIDNQYDLDFAVSRNELYTHPGALPKVQKADIFDDLFRRDFTINALAIALHPAEYGYLYDFFKAREDVENRILKVLHRFSFLDDPTRIIRGIRLVLQLDLDIEEETKALMQEAIRLSRFSDVTFPRIYKELRFLFAANPGLKFIELLREVPFLRLLYDDYKIPVNIEEKWQRADRYLAYFENNNYNVKKWPVYFSLILKDIPRSIIERWSLNLKAKNIILFKPEEYEIDKITDSAGRVELYNNLKQFTNEELVLLLAEHDNEQLQEKIFYYLENISDINIAIDGNDLIELGYQEGPIISKALRLIKRQVLKGNLQSRDKQLKYAKKLKKKLERK
ncbi:MAG TPA: CBS domain-containing protein [Halanaerobiales bacterium]|nr:CBS domain-containing protein [Halanaerobiales bacterium]